MTKSILFLGGTGYIGSEALDKILQVAGKDVSVTVYGRNGSVLEKIAALDPRIKTEKGTLENCDKLEKLAAEHDITINCANADGIEATKALNRGLKARFDKTGKKPILIYTSGTGTLSDNAAGNSDTDKIYTDGQAEPNAKPPLLPMSALADTAFHRPVDLAIVEADEQGYVDAYIIVPSTIYGIADNQFASKGLANPQSVQMPLLYRIALSRGKAGMVGEGKNLWPNVHIADVGDLFVLVYKTATSGSGGDHGANGYYFAENGEYSLRQAAEQIGKVLKEKGLIQSAEPAPLAPDELKKYTGGSTYSGGNSRARAVHSKALGWKPKHDTNDFLASFKEDIEWTLSHDRGKDKAGNYQFGPGPRRVDGGWALPE